MTPRRLLEPARLAGASLLRCQNDARLIDMVRDGQDRAFEAIVARHRAELHRHCRQLLPPGRAEDALQQALLNAYQAIKADPEASIDLRPWLHRIAHNACLSALRQNGWRHDEIDPDRDGAEGPEQVVERRHDLRSTLAAVQALPERQRDALLLRELAGRSHQSIAAELGVSDGAVRQLLHRARTTLRAAATALTPAELVYRAGGMGGSEGTIASRIAEAATGAGGTATLAKVGAAVLVSGVIAGGATTVPSRVVDTDYSAHAAEASPHALDHGHSGGGGSGAERRSAGATRVARRTAGPETPRARSGVGSRRSGHVRAERRRRTESGERGSGTTTAVPQPPAGAPESTDPAVGERDSYEGTNDRSEPGEDSGSSDHESGNEDGDGGSEGSDSQKDGSGDGGSDYEDRSDRSRSGSGDGGGGDGGGDGEDD